MICTYRSFRCSSDDPGKIVSIPVEEHMLFRPLAAEYCLSPNEATKRSNNEAYGSRSCPDPKALPFRRVFGAICWQFREQVEQDIAKNGSICRILSNLTNLSESLSSSPALAANQLTAAIPQQLAMISSVYTTNA